MAVQQASCLGELPDPRRNTGCGQAAETWHDGTEPGFGLADPWRWRRWQPGS